MGRDLFKTHCSMYETMKGNPCVLKYQCLVDYLYYSINIFAYDISAAGNYELYNFIVFWQLIFKTKPT